MDLLDRYRGALLLGGALLEKFDISCQPGFVSGLDHEIVRVFLLTPALGSSSSTTGEGSTPICNGLLENQPIAHSPVLRMTGRAGRSSLTSYGRASGARRRNTQGASPLPRVAAAGQWSAARRADAAVPGSVAHACLVFHRLIARTLVFPVYHACL